MFAYTRRCSLIPLTMLLSMTLFLATPFAAHAAFAIPKIFSSSGNQITVVLSDAAPTGGCYLAVSSDAPSVISVPATVFVASRQTSVSFAVQTGSTSGTATISVTLNGSTDQTTITVAPE